MNKMLKNPMFIRQVIMDHYQNPRNKKLFETGNYIEKHMNSDSCIDDIKVQMIIEDDIIKDVVFDGIACTISTASTSIMTELLKNKSLKEGLEIIDEYNKMIYEKEFNEEILGSAIVFENVSKQANRIKCATIGFDAAEFIIKKSSDKDE